MIEMRTLNFGQTFDMAKYFKEILCKTKKGGCQLKRCMFGTWAALKAFMQQEMSNLWFLQ